MGNGASKLPEMTPTLQPCSVLANSLGGTISGNLAPTLPPEGMDVQNQLGNLQPCSVLANFLGGTISGNLATTLPPAGMDL